MNVNLTAKLSKATLKYIERFIQSYLLEAFCDISHPYKLLTF